MDGLVAGTHLTPAGVRVIARAPPRTCEAGCVGDDLVTRGSVVGELGLAVPGFRGVIDEHLVDNDGDALPAFLAGDVGTAGQATSSPSRSSRTSSTPRRSAASPPPGPPTCRRWRASSAQAGSHEGC